MKLLTEQQANKLIEMLIDKVQNEHALVYTITKKNLIHIRHLQEVFEAALDIDIADNSSCEE